MSVTPEDQPTLWVKLVPNNRISAEGFWSTKLIPGYHAVQRSRQRPATTVDAVTYQDLKIAVEDLLDEPIGCQPELQELRLAFRKLKDFEMRGR